MHPKAQTHLRAETPPLAPPRKSREGRKSKLGNITPLRGVIFPKPLTRKDNLEMVHASEGGIKHPSAFLVINFLFQFRQVLVNELDGDGAFANR
jgi:hypothetical protein